MMGLGNIRTGMVGGLMATEIMGPMADDERADYAVAGARSDTVTLYVEDRDKGELLGYAVLGKSDNDAEIVIYMANSFAVGMTKAMLQAVFKAIGISGHSMRVHMNDPRRAIKATIATYAKMLGAADAFEGVDADGLPMGVFSNGQ